MVNLKSCPNHETKIKIPLKTTYNLVEREGFEPSIPCGIHAFQASSFGHSDTSPNCKARKIYVFKGDFKQNLIRIACWRQLEGVARMLGLLPFCGTYVPEWYLFQKRKQMFTFIGHNQLIAGG